MSTNDVEIDLEKHEVFSSAIVGLPKVAELIATFPFEDRQRALEAAKRAISKLRGGWATKKQRLSDGRRR